MSKKRALVIAPGRGTYNKSELGYLQRYHADKSAFIKMVDDYRTAHNQETVTSLDTRERYSLKEHTQGDNASPLIYACAYSDYLSIDRDKFEIVAATGNSMGWYIALGCGNALSPESTMAVINTMGTFMQESLIGGQLIYPFVDEGWREIPGKRDEIFAIADRVNAEPNCDVYTSIELGGMLVLAGNDEAIKGLMETLPPVQERFPLILQNHAAFHTSLQQPISQKALQTFDSSVFQAPSLPLIDGRGHIWRPHTTDASDIFRYTLGHQVCEYYDFTRAVQVGMKEYAPDCIIILGPGSTLGGAVAQCLIDIGWDGLTSKKDFTDRQASDNPIIYAMGIEEQRATSST